MGEREEIEPYESTNLFFSVAWNWSFFAVHLIANNVPVSSDLRHFFYWQPGTALQRILPRATVSE